jgi:hypothetical protein
MGETPASVLKPHFKIWICLLAMWSAPIAAVSLSVDPSGQLLLLPYYQVGNGFQTIFEIRNKDLVDGRAVRVVFKDPINGRPNLSLNVYLGPSDSWSTAIYDPSGSNNPNQMQAALVRWTDQSCTFPSIDVVPPVIGNRLTTGFIEIYDMGVIDAELANDCAAIAARWATGAWSGTDTTEVRNDGVSAPSGSLEGYAAVIDVSQGLAFHFEALVFDDFRNQPLHTHPDEPRHPGLSDVLPAESRILESVQFANRTILAERVSTWSEDPVNAVDALLMTVTTRADFSSNLDVGAIGSVILVLPTRAYHTDAESFYGNPRRLDPFKVTVPTRSDENLRDNEVTIKSLDREGLERDLTTNPNATDCDLVNGSLAIVFMINQFGFDRTCEFVISEFRVPDNAQEGEVRLSFDGEIVSDEGHIYRGQPVFGLLLQTLQNQNLPLAGGIQQIANYSWVRSMKSDRSITDPE